MLRTVPMRLPRGFPYRESARLVAHDGHAFHLATIRIIVVGGVMLGRAIIPTHDGAWLPAQAELIFRHMRLLVEKIEDRLALACLHAFDPQRELRIDIDRLAAVHGMGAHHRMDR